MLTGRRLGTILHDLVAQHGRSPLACPAVGEPLRVGMVCPYSLSVPGGVQQQVLGLGRELRRMGVEVRVLAPCDGRGGCTSC